MMEVCRDGKIPANRTTNPSAPLDRRAHKMGCWGTSRHRLDPIQTPCILEHRDLCCRSAWKSHSLVASVVHVTELDDALGRDRRDTQHCVHKHDEYNE
jgi:hypothetical protein